MRSTRQWVLVGAFVALTGFVATSGISVAEAQTDPQTTTEGAADGTTEGLPETEAGAEATSAPVEGAEGEAATTSAEPMDAGTYAVRLRDLEQRINELKEQIFRSKARLSLLAETVLQGVVAGAQAIIVHENRMSSSYKLVKAVYALDGAPIFNRADEDGDSLSEREEFQVYNGSIVPGEHTLTVNLEYRGHGYGIFSYLKGYRFKVRSNYNFTAPEGRAVTVRVVAYEKGGPTAPLEDRPAIRYVERVQDRARARAEAQAAEAEGDE
ncbi:MAG: hypothetical protein H6721_29705 [Sandaracinus sp.]|nr:hypothetical protein [Sandaracinus sp.]MCB9623403.1 hypothetical protein [Sandaracinus sp.]MCB9636308.1 hypothetical protein [Sandaracinus sp.]